MNMPTQQPPYGHPGPSTYFHQPSLMSPYSYAAGNGNVPPPYPYHYGTQPLNGHANIQPSSPRVPVPGQGRGAYHGPRGAGPSYANYHPHPAVHHQPHPAQHLQQSQHAAYLHHPGHMPIHSPQPSPTSPQPFPSQQPQKYPPPPHHGPFSPSYAPIPPSGPYAQNCHQQQPISPLPNQLSMPLPPPLSPLMVPAHPPPRHDNPPPMPMANEAIVEMAPLNFIPSYGELPRDGPQSDAAPASPYQTSVDAPTNFQPSSRPQTPASPHNIANSVAASVSSMTNPKHLFVGWAIWSRRPHDPSRAPGIIISPRACPPPDVVEKSLQLPTPPSSPRLRPVPVTLTELSVPEHDYAHVDVLRPDDESLPKVLADELSPPPDQQSSSATETETTPGCSTAPDTPIPGSPLSTNTSISITGTALSHGKAGSQSSKSSKAKIIATEDSNATPSSEPQSPDASTAPAATPQPEASTSTPSKPVPLVIPTLTPAAAAPKKSWADMLRNQGAAAAFKGSNALPTSSVVGISIPASASASPDSQARITPVRRPELVNILSGTPAQTGAPRIRPRGLINSGNMCFANAVLQLLVYCPPFWRLFNELGKYLPGEQEDAVKSHTPFVDATVTFLKEFRPQEKSQSASGYFNGNARVNGNGKGKEVELPEEEDGMQSFIPSYVYEAMKETRRFENMRGGHQEDAEEFLGFYLDTLEEELLSLLSTLNPSKAAPAPAPANTKAVEEREEELPKEDGWLEVGKRNKLVVTRTVRSTESPITRIFGGKFRSTLRAPHQRDSVVVEDWRALQLDIQPDTVRTIKDALSHISHPQSVQVTSPTKPGIIIEASQQILIESLPPILVLHLKRFLYDTTAKGVVKIGKMVEFSPELEIPNDIVASGRRSAHPMRYQLYGVLYHHGMSASGGHYTLDVLHPNRDLSTKPREAWIRIDDELVSDVRPADVFDGLDRDDRCAYLLFYRRIGAGARS